jgi:hypothetical protein
MYTLMRISGLTTNAGPEEITTGLVILERMILSYENNGLFLSYNRSEDYPIPDPAEESGLGDKNIQAVVLLLFKNVCPALGKQFPLELREEADTAYRGLFDTIPPTRRQNPMQPAGQGMYRGCYADSWYRSYMNTDEQITVENDGTLDEITI